MKRPGLQVGATPRTPSVLPCCAQTGHTGWMEHPSAHPSVGSQVRRCGRSAVPRSVCPAPDTQRRTRPIRMEKGAAMIGIIQPIHRRKVDSKAASAVAPNQLAMGQGIEGSSRTILSRTILSVCSIGPHLLSQCCERHLQTTDGRRYGARSIAHRRNHRGVSLSARRHAVELVVANRAILMKSSRHLWPHLQIRIPNKNTK
jgi:hypothetical protein